MLHSASGEMSSNASSENSNIDRTIVNTDLIARKLPGCKVDMLFKANLMKFG